MLQTNVKQIIIILHTGNNVIIKKIKIVLMLFQYLTIILTIKKRVAHTNQEEKL
jgi:hypothetical protein